MRLCLVYPGNVLLFSQLASVFVVWIFPYVIQRLRLVRTSVKCWVTRTQNAKSTVRLFVQDVVRDKDRRQWRNTYPKWSTTPVCWLTTFLLVFESFCADKLEVGGYVLVCGCQTGILHLRLTLVQRC